MDLDHAFPEWLRRLDPLLAEEDTNPLFHAFRNRRKQAKPFQALLSKTTLPHTVTKLVRKRRRFRQAAEEFYAMPISGRDVAVAMLLEEADRRWPHVLAATMFINLVSVIVAALAVQSGGMSFLLPCVPLAFMLWQGSHLAFALRAHLSFRRARRWLSLPWVTRVLEARLHASYLVIWWILALLGGLGVCCGSFEIVASLVGDAVDLGVALVYGFGFFYVGCIFFLVNSAIENMYDEGVAEWLERDVEIGYHLGHFHDVATDRDGESWVLWRYRDRALLRRKAGG